MVTTDSGQLNQRASVPGRRHAAPRFHDCGVRRRRAENYKEFLETELAVPVLDGRKTESEKFAGAAHTYSVEALMGDGRALQAGTSHHLGQNFAKVFDITFQARDKSVQYVWQTSWGMTTRLIGGVIMVHGDDSGLILPPRIAPYQVVIVPIPRGDWRATVLPRAQDVAAALKRAGVRVMLDDREEYKPGWKFSEWEMRGVPLRLEIGPRDIEQQQVLVARRDTREKATLPMEGLSERVSGLLDAVQTALLERAVAFRDSHTIRTASSDEFRRAFEGRPRIRDCAVVRVRRLRGTDQGGNAGDDPQPRVRSAPRDRRLRALRPAGPDRRVLRQVVLSRTATASAPRGLRGGSGGASPHGRCRAQAAPHRS